MLSCCPLQTEVSELMSLTCVRAALSLFSRSDEDQRDEAQRKRDEMILLLKKAKVPAAAWTAVLGMRLPRSNVSRPSPAQRDSGAAARRFRVPPSGCRSGSSDRQPAGHRLHLQPGNLRLRPLTPWLPDP